MGVRTPETCWAVNKRQDNKLKKLLQLVGDFFFKLNDDALTCKLWIRHMSQSILSQNRYNKMCYHYLLQGHFFSSHTLYSFIPSTSYRKYPLSIVYFEFSVSFFFPTLVSRFAVLILKIIYPFFLLISFYRNNFCFQFPFFCSSASPSFPDHQQFC